MKRIKIQQCVAILLLIIYWTAAVGPAYGAENTVLNGQVAATIKSAIAWLADNERIDEFGHIMGEIPLNPLRTERFQRIHPIRHCFIEISGSYCGRKNAGDGCK